MDSGYVQQQAARLEGYIEKCHHHHQKSPGEGARPVFDDKPRTPQLIKGRINRIVLYPGSFNPPHRGHKALLKGAYHRAQEISAIAAVVFPLDDEASDQEISAHCICLSKTQKARLWLPNKSSCWYYVYDGTRKDWDTFQGELIRIAGKDGYEIEFVLLCGPDHMSQERYGMGQAWGCKKIIVGEASSNPAIAGYRDILFRLRDCHSWQPVPWDVEKAPKRSKNPYDNVMEGLDGFAIHVELDEDPHYYEKLASSIRKLALGKSPRRDKRARWTDQPSGSEPTVTHVYQIKSAHLRDIIATCPLERLCAELRLLVLNPEVLVAMVTQMRNST